MDVADFLEFERALEGDGEAHVASEVDDRGRVVHRAGELAHALPAAQNRGDGVRNARELVHVVGDLVRVLVAANLGQVQAQDVAGRDLGRECLGGGDGDLGSGVREDHGVGFA